MKVTITGDQLAFLQEISTPERKMSLLELDLSKLDGIISRMTLFQEENKFMEWGENFICLVKKSPISKIFLDPYALILIANVLCIIFLPNFRRVSYAWVVLIIIGHFIIFESWMEYNSKKMVSFYFI